MIPWLAKSATDHPDALALVAGDLTLTYSQLATEAQRRAATLHTLGIRPKSIVGLHTAPDSENSLEWVATTHAIFCTEMSGWLASGSHSGRNTKPCR